MSARSPTSKLRLQGFNNLTKTLSFNIYDIAYTPTLAEQVRYSTYIDEVYSAERLIQILRQVSNIIGANILNIAHQDYDPKGASVTLLLCEEPIASQVLADTESLGSLSEAVVCHLDKSHITVHTYPETQPDHGISTFRTDIDVSTCGRISPLKTLNYLIHSFDADLIVIDYRVRGFTRDITGKKHFIDHHMHSIQNYLSKATRARYQMLDVNVYQAYIFHTRMILKHFDLKNYLFSTGDQPLSARQQAEIAHQIRREMAEIFHGENLTKSLLV
jgi:S-adenosylmethionine decarboxylase